jgi:hypothetical protein
MTGNGLRWLISHPASRLYWILIPCKPIILLKPLQPKQGFFEMVACDSTETRVANTTFEIKTLQLRKIYGGGIFGRPGENIKELPDYTPAIFFNTSNSSFPVALQSA